MTVDHEILRASGLNPTHIQTETTGLARSDARANLLRHGANRCCEGTHVAKLVIKPETGTITAGGSLVAEDFGNLINLMGGRDKGDGAAVQGIGQVSGEPAVDDAKGQRLTATFVGYALPRATDVPMIGFTSAPVPPSRNRMALTGRGTAGTLDALAEVANAVQNALWEHGERQADLLLISRKVRKVLSNGSVTVR